MERHYELMILVDPEYNETHLIDEVEKIFSEFSISVVEKDKWGLRTLAYPINKKPQARYLVYRLSPQNHQNLVNLNQELLMKDNILRFKLLRI